MIPSFYEVMRPFYENEVLTNIPGLLGLAANAAIYLSLAWEFTQRLQKTQPSAPES